MAADEYTDTWIIISLKYPIINQFRHTASDSLSFGVIIYARHWTVFTIIAMISQNQNFRSSYHKMRGFVSSKNWGKFWSILLSESIIYIVWIFYRSKIIPRVLYIFGLIKYYIYGPACKIFTRCVIARPKTTKTVFVPTIYSVFWNVSECEIR